MARYDVQCIGCGRFDEQWKTMPRYGGLPDFDVCEHCGGQVTKLYDSPADHSDNTFKPRWSDNLSTGSNPVYVKTADEYRHLKKKLGLTEHEPGMSQDRARNVREQQTRERDRAFNRMFGGLAP